MKRNVVINDNFLHHTKGVLFYVPNRGKFIEGKPSKGFGSIKYSEGSVYTGDLYYDGTNFNKIGFGQQDFSESYHYYTYANGKNITYTVFVGKFDYRKTDWIYGNGVLYYRDEFGLPAGFIVGFFKGLCKVGKWRGEPFDYSSLAYGYNKEMELTFEPDRTDYFGNFKRFNNFLCKPNTKYHFMFIGDSYFDFLRDTVYTGFDMDKELGKSYVNLGVNGSEYVHWKKCINLINANIDPDHIFINLGFNDVHFGYTGDKLVKIMKEVLIMIKTKFPTSTIHLFTAVHSPAYQSCKEYEVEYNKYILSHKDELGVNVYDVSKLIRDAKENCFNEDGVHPSKEGYSFYYEYFKRF